MRTLFAIAFLLIATLPANAANFPYIRLNGKTNIVSDNGTNLTYNGSALAGGAPTYPTITNAMSWSGDTNNVIGGDGHERTISSGGQPASATLTNLSNGIGTDLTNLLAAAVQAAQTNVVTTNFVQKTGDTMTGSLSVGGTNQSYFTNGLISGPITITNAATATTPFVINGASGETVDQMQVRVGGGAPIFTINRYGGVASADDLVSGNNIVASQNGLIYWQSAAIMRAPSNGVFRFTDYSSVISNSVLQAGSITLYKQTNQVSFAGTNAPPGDISTIATWISVQVAGDTNAWRLPLYK